MKFKFTSKLSPPIIDQIVSIHMKLLKESFLTCFGLKFLKVFYNALREDKNSIVIVAIDHTRKPVVAGFLIALKSAKSSQKELLRKNFLQLALPMLSTFIKNPILIFTCFIGLLNQAQKDEAQLQFLAVDSLYQRSGLGTKMVTMLSQELKKKGIKSYAIAVEIKNRGANNFYKKIGCLLLQKEKIFHSTRNIYLYEIP